MNRRALLSTIGVAALGGCAGLTADPEPTSTGTPTDSPTATERTTDTGPTPDDEPTPDEAADLEYVWRYDVGGWIDGFADGKAYCREHWIDDDGDGRVVALDAETGERRWAYGFADGYEFYSDFLVRDALYFGRGDDQMGGGAGEVDALGFDGSERWTDTEIGSVYTAPRLVDGALYVVDDHGSARCFDPDTGEVRWESEDLPRPRSPEVAVLHVDDVVLVKSRLLVGLDRDDGEVLWTYGDEDETYGPQVTVAEGTAYVDRNDGDVARVASDGTEVWRRDLDAGTRGVCADRVILETAGERRTLYGLDAASGEERWTVQDSEYRVGACTDGRVVARDHNGEALYAFDAVDGTPLWSDSVSTVSLQQVRTVDRESRVYVETDSAELHRVTLDGEVTESWSFQDDIVDVTVWDDLYVSTVDHVYRLSLS